MFKKWKMEKLRKLEEEKQKKKPVFKVGIVQRTATGSPLKISNNARKQVRGIENNQLLCQGNLTKENTEGIITRSKTKAKAGMSENHLKCQEGITKQLLSTNTNVKLKNEFCKIDSGKAKSLDSYKFNPPKSVTQLPLSSKLTYPNSSNLSNKRKKNLPLVKRNPCEPDEINLNVSKDKFTSVKVTPQELKNDLNQDLDDFRSPAKKVAFQKENVQIINYSPFMSRRKNESKISSCASSDKNLTKEKNEFQYKISLFRYITKNF